MREISWLYRFEDRIKERGWVFIEKVRCQDGHRTTFTTRIRLLKKSSQIHCSFEKKKKCIFES